MSAMEVLEVPVNAHGKKIYRLVLTGGPCGGKTTAQAVITTVFESLGWKVYRTPEVATILLSGGVKFAELGRNDAFRFQENLMRTMLQIEQTFCDLARNQSRDVLIVCDRGLMDAVAYTDPEDWAEMKSMNSWNEVSLRDKRYDHVCHMVSAADGAEAFYTNANNSIRSEPIELARELDRKCQRAWVGHPYFDVIDNSTPFPEKINRLVRAIATRMGIDLSDRFDSCARKRKWLVKEMPSDVSFPKFEDFDVQLIYLLSPVAGVEARIRRRTKPGSISSFQHTLRRSVEGRKVETRQQMSHRDFEMLLTQRDMDHGIAEMKRRCFMYKNHYFQLDRYQLPVSCNGLMILTTYATRDRKVDLPDFLNIDREVTSETAYSMYNLTLKKDVKVSKMGTIAINNGHLLSSSPIPMNGSQASGRMIEELIENCCLQQSHSQTNGNSSSAS